ncbi:MAG TPA: biotin-dependent carboxyltransferase family protein [Propionibacteriaceae bacterium]|nr:biotin-dependent carboxyltransferase family protein [Propionibacteriaceae bacterium]
MTARAVLEVLATGPLALIQDFGRPGQAAVGVSESGAADRWSFQLGARLLAQDYRAASIEITFGGLAVRAHGEVMGVLTGARAPARRNGVAEAYCAPFMLRDQQTLQLGQPQEGLRSYLSVRGGIDVPTVLGSRATDLLSGLGPDPLQVGDLLPVGPAPRHFPVVDVAPVPSPSAGPLTLRAILGPREDWLADPRMLATTSWTVSSRSDRIGIRLEGRALERHPSHAGQELPTEGVVRGAIQIPASGEPVIFLADHPVTGGYPVAAVLTEDDSDLAAQAVPGQVLRIALVRH